jgi:5-methylcytosine-specific restriction enzyme A
LSRSTRLLALFDNLARGPEHDQLPKTAIAPAEDEEGHEGELKKLLVRQRRREGRFRSKKIMEVMRSKGGRLLCEVPHCGFDFHARYGELGAGFAEVHYKKPLSWGTT